MYEKNYIWEQNTNMLFDLHLSGDGANDVNMIRAADIGVGISGQEGMQVWKKQNSNLQPLRLRSGAATSETLLRSAGGHGEWLCHTSLQAPEEAAAGSRPLVLQPPGQHDHLLLLQERGEWSLGASRRCALDLSRLTPAGAV